MWSSANININRTKINRRNERLCSETPLGHFLKSSNWVQMTTGQFEEDSIETLLKPRTDTHRVVRPAALHECTSSPPCVIGSWMHILCALFSALSSDQHTLLRPLLSIEGHNYRVTAAYEAPTAPILANDFIMFQIAGWIIDIVPLAWCFCFCRIMYPYLHCVMMRCWNG